MSESLKFKVKTSIKTSASISDDSKKAMDELHKSLLADKKNGEVEVKLKKKDGSYTENELTISGDFTASQKKLATSLKSKLEDMLKKSDDGDTTAKLSASS